MVTGQKCQFPVLAVALCPTRVSSLDVRHLHGAVRVRAYLGCSSAPRACEESPPLNLVKCNARPLYRGSCQGSLSHFLPTNARSEAEILGQVLHHEYDGISAPSLSRKRCRKNDRL